jgi:hypothetical protein
MKNYYAPFSRLISIMSFCFPNCHKDGADLHSVRGSDDSSDHFFKNVHFKKNKNKNIYNEENF